MTTPGHGTGRDDAHVRASRRLAYVLRHDPASVGLEIDAAGWVDVDDLLAALALHGLVIDRPLLDELVEPEGKRRFAYDPTRTRVRASQGHSVEVDLGLRPSAPPRLLFHGTTARAVGSIERHGLRPGDRHHVHLSASLEQAQIVGARRQGTTVIFEVDAAGMHRDGCELFLADNGVWLTASVPASYLRRR